MYMDRSEPQTYVQNTVKNAIAAQKIAGTKTPRPVYPFASEWYCDSVSCGVTRLKPEDLALDITAPYNLGADGVVIWGSLGALLAIVLHFILRLNASVSCFVFKAALKDRRASGPSRQLPRAELDRPAAVLGLHQNTDRPAREELPEKDDRMLEAALLWARALQHCPRQQ